MIQTATLSPTSPTLRATTTPQAGSVAGGVAGGGAGSFAEFFAQASDDAPPAATTGDVPPDLQSPSSTRQDWAATGNGLPIAALAGVGAVSWQAAMTPQPVAAKPDASPVIPDAALLTATVAVSVPVRPALTVGRQALGARPPRSSRSDQGVETDDLVPTEHSEPSKAPPTEVPRHEEVTQPLLVAPAVADTASPEVVASATPSPTRSSPGGVVAASPEAAFKPAANRQAARGAMDSPDLPNGNASPDEPAGAANRAASKRSANLPSGGSTAMTDPVPAGAPRPALADPPLRGRMPHDQALPDSAYLLAKMPGGSAVAPPVASVPLPARVGEVAPNTTLLTPQVPEFVKAGSTAKPMARTSGQGGQITQPLMGVLASPPPPIAEASLGTAMTEVQRVSPVQMGSSVPFAMPASAGYGTVTGRSPVPTDASADAVPIMTATPPVIGTPRWTATEATAPVALAVAQPGAVQPQPGTVASAAQVFGAAIQVASKARDDTEAKTGSLESVLGSTAPAPLVQSAPATAQHTALDMRQERWPHAMIERIDMLRDAANATDTRIRLIPDALGAIDVSMRKDGDTVHVHFNAEQAATRTLLADAQPRLAELAEARGLKLGQAMLGDGNTGSNAGSSQQRAPATTNAPNRATAASAVIADPTEDTRIA